MGILNQNEFPAIFAKDFDILKIKIVDYKLAKYIHVLC